jgi:hypothetical protein
MSTDTMGSVETQSGRHPKRTSGGAMGPVLAGVGALLLVVGALIHFYAIPKLAVTPTDVNTTTHLAASGATIFDAGTLKPITTDLTITNQTRGDVAGTQAKGTPSKVLILASLTTIRSADGEIRSQSTDSYAADKKTAEASSCCAKDNFAETSKGVRTLTKPTGLILKFPFGTKKQTYLMWDPTLGKAVKNTYAGTTTRHGMKVYEFKSSVPASVVGHQSLPGSLFGEKDNLTADSYYQNDTTQWVEPTTGAIIDEDQNVKNWFQSPSGVQVPTTVADIKYTPGQVSYMVSHYKGQVAMLKLAESFVPWIIMLLGLALIGGGLLRGRRQTA